jgi:hypothetical protein
VVFPTNKTLSHAVTERRRYIALAHIDHLDDKNTYKRLSQHETYHKLEHIAKLITAWLRKYKEVIPQNEQTFIRRSTKVKDD